MPLEDSRPGTNRRLTGQPTLVRITGHRHALKLVSFIPGLLAALLLSGCGNVATIRQTHPVLAATAWNARPVMRLARQDPQTALGRYLDAAHDASEILRRDPQNKEALATYNFATARVVETIKKAGINPWDGAIKVPAPTGSYTLRGRVDRPDRHPMNYRLVPADTLEVGGNFFAERVRIEGLGAPIVAVGQGELDQLKQILAMPRIYAAFTAILRFQGREANLEFIEPFQFPGTTFQGHAFPVAADLTAPFALLVAKERPQRFGRPQMLRPEAHREAAIARLQPYDPNRIPVLFVHGLQNTGATWAPMIAAMIGDPELRRRYQFWVFDYPSGYPYCYSAALLRAELDRVNQVFSDHKDIVLIGHSMGGCISRLMLTDSGDVLWKDMFGEDTPVPTATGEAGTDLALKSLVFKHRPEVKRVIFLATPHRGSEMASGWIGRVGSGLIRMPEFNDRVATAIRSVPGEDDARAAYLVRHVPNSIDSLSSENPFVAALINLPMAPGVPYHSIVGDRGKGNTPDSSDGVVPYWSSHLESARSEIVVPHGHAVHQHPEAIAEVVRILKGHR